MSQAHITETENNLKALNAADKYAQDGIKSSVKNTLNLSAKATASIAALAMMLSKLALEGIKGILESPT